MRGMEQLFDLMVHRADNAGAAFPVEIDLGGGKFKKISVPWDQQEKVIKSSIQAFMMKTGSLGSDPYGNKLPFEKRAPIQAFSGSSDLPVLTKDVFSVNAQTPNFDLNWQESFKGMTLRKGDLSWEITDVSTGGGFELISEGGKVKIQSVSGNKAIVGVNKYGYGLGVTWETVEGRKLYAFVDAMDMARSKMYENWADTHYTLLATGAAITPIAWSGIATDPTVSRDIGTINLGAYTIADKTKDSGYGDTANAMMVLYVSPKYRSRVEAAFKSVISDVVGGRVAGGAGSVDGQAINWNVEVRYTFNGNIPADTAVLVLPGQKIQNAMYMRELGLSRQEIESLSELRTYWTAYGAAVGDNDQVALLSLT